MFTHRFKNGDDVSILLLVADTAWQDGAAINKHAGAIHTGHGDQAAGHVFIATADGYVAVQPFTTHNGFDRVSDHFA